MNSDADKLVVYFGRERFIRAPSGIVHCCVPVERGRVGDEVFGRYESCFSGISANSVYVGVGAEVADFDNGIAARLPARPTALFIRDNGAGDVIMSTAAVREARRRLPRAKFIYATLPAHIELLKGNPDIDEAVSVHELNLETGGYDLIVNWARAVEDYSIPRNHAHRIDSFARMIGIELTDRRVFLEPSEAERGFARRFLEGKGERFIGYVVQAAAWNRTWPVWRVPELLEKFALELPGHKIVLIDSQAEAGFDAPNAVNACGATRTFKQAAALLECCEMAITPDTGLAHACGALGVPTLVLAAAIPPRLRFGYYENFSWIHPEGRVRCCPCWSWQNHETPEAHYEFCAKSAAPLCLESITPEEIVERARNIIHEMRRKK